MRVGSPSLRSLGSVLLLAACAFAQDTTVVYRGATVWPGDGPAIEDAVVVVRNGRIEAMDRGLAIPDGATVIDVPGKFITPGLVDAAFDGAISALDANEQGTEVTPSLRVLDALDPQNPAFARVRNGGVTTVHLMPGTRNVIGGLSAVVQTWAKDPQSMLVRDEVSLRMVLGAEPSGGNRAIRGGNVDSIYYRRPTSRMGVIWAARRAFYDAKEHLAESPGGVRVTRTTQELRDLSVLARVLQGTLPLVTTARNEQDLRTALRLAAEFGYTPVVDEAQEAHMVVDELAAARVWVMVSSPSADDVGGSAGQDGAEPRHSTLLRLSQKGVPFVVTTGSNSLGTELVREMMFAHRFGLTKEEALAAVTSRPAKLLGLADRKGRLRPGLDADLVVWSADPFDPASTPVTVVLGGTDTTSLP